MDPMQFESEAFDLKQRIAILEERLERRESPAPGLSMVAIAIALVLLGGVLSNVAPSALALRISEQPAIVLALAGLLLAVALTTWLAARAAFRIEREGAHIRSLAASLSGRLADRGRSPARQAD